MTSFAFADLLATARAAALAGDTLRARHAFRQATELDPTSVAAWLGLAATTAVLRERRGFYERALRLDPSCTEARERITAIDTLLATGALLLPRAVPLVEPECPLLAHHALASLVIPLPTIMPEQARPHVGLLSVAVIGVATMGLLTMVGIFVLTNIWGFLVAFIAGPSVSELMLWLTARARKGLGGRPLQLAAAIGMLLGSVGAIVLGSLLLPRLGPSAPVAVLLPSPGLLVFVTSAVAATAYRLE